MFFVEEQLYENFLKKNKKTHKRSAKTMTEKLSVKLHAQVRVVIYEIITADRKSSLTEKQQEITLLNIH